MQEVQIVPAPLQFWHGDMHAWHVKPSQYVLGAHEVHVVAEVEQYWQGN